MENIHSQGRERKQRYYDKLQHKYKYNLNVKKENVHYKKTHLLRIFSISKKEKPYCWMY